MKMSDTHCYEALINENQRHFIEKSGYEIKFLTSKNAAIFMPKEKTNDLEKAIGTFKMKINQRFSSNNKPEDLEKKAQAMINRVIALHVIEANGGVMLE